MLYRNGENTVHSTMFYGNYFAGNGNEGVAEVDITRKNKKNPYKKSVRKSVTISRPYNKSVKISQIRVICVLKKQFRIPISAFRITSSAPFSAPTHTHQQPCDTGIYHYSYYAHYHLDHSILHYVSLPQNSHLKAS